MFSRKYYATSAVIAGMMIAVLAITTFTAIGFSTTAFAQGGGKSPQCPERGTAGTGDPHDGAELSGNPHDIPQGFRTGNPHDACNEGS